MYIEWRFDWASLSFNRWPQVQQMMPGLQYNKHSLHCVLGSVSNNSRQLYVAHVLNHSLGRRTKWVVGIVLL